MERETKRRPSRRTLLAVVERCQDLFGRISVAASDRNPNRAADLERLTKQGHALCVDARRFDPPEEPSDGR